MTCPWYQHLLCQANLLHSSKKAPSHWCNFFLSGRIFYFFGVSGKPRRDKTPSYKHACRTAGKQRALSSCTFVAFCPSNTVLVERGNEDWFIPSHLKWRSRWNETWPVEVNSSILLVITGQAVAEYGFSLWQESSLLQVRRKQVLHSRRRRPVQSQRELLPWNEEPGRGLSADLSPPCDQVSGGLGRPCFRLWRGMHLSVEVKNNTSQTRVRHLRVLWNVAIP